jgi:hypothetical protein
MTIKNISEELFEKYLRSQDLPFEFEKKYQDKSKLVDYTVPIDGRDFLFEVKQFEQRNYPLPTSVSAVDYYGPIRAKIDQAQRKFKEYAGFPCCLVLHSNEAFVMDDPRAAFGAMYGDIGIQIPVAAGIVTVAMPLPEPTFVGDNGKMVRKDKPYNTRISALIHVYEYHVGLATWIRWVHQTQQRKDGTIKQQDVDMPDIDIEEKCVAVSVWENMYASVPLPESVFKGAYDERWGLVGDYVRCKFKGRARIDE